MAKIGLRTKLALLLVTGLASVGINLGGGISQAGSCGTCVQLWEGGRLVGYGCKSGGMGVCTAGVSYCSIDYTQRCS